MENLIRNNYTFLEAEEILAFFREHKIDHLIEKEISLLNDRVEDQTCSICE